MADFGLIALGAAEAYTDKKISQIPIPKAWLGNTTTALSEGSTANPIMIDNKPVTAESGNIAAYDDTEYIFTGTVWQKFGGKFSDLTDVNVSSPTDGQIVRYNGTSGKYENSNETTYENKQAASGGTDVSLVTTGDKYNWDHLPTTLAGMSDVSIANLQYGDEIVWDSIKNTYVNSNNQTIKIVSWAKGTDAEIAAMVAAHYNGYINLADYWTVGDVRSVDLSVISNEYAAQTVDLVLSNVGGKTLTNENIECAFQVDQVNCLNGNRYSANSSSWENSTDRTLCNGGYRDAYPSELKQIFKQFNTETGNYDLGSQPYIQTTADYFALRSEKEITGTNNFSLDGEGTLVEYYKTSSNRVKTFSYQYNQNHYLTRSPIYYSYDIYRTIINASGEAYRGSAGATYYGFPPFGCI